MLKFITNFFRNLFKEKIENGKGWTKDPTDYRDVLLESVIKDRVDIPKTYNLPFKLPIKNQGREPACVGYACSTIKDFLELKEQNEIEFDGLWIYKKAKEIDNMPNFKGTYFRAGLKVLQKFGAKPLNGKEEDAEKYKIGGYTKVESNFESIKEAIYRFGPVLVGFKGSNQGWRNARIRPPKFGEKTWGHGVALALGYTKNLIIIHNSWGENRGDKGYFYFDKNYPIISAHVVLVDLPNNWADLIPNKTDKPSHYFREDLKRGMRGREVVMLQDCLKWLGCFDKAIDSSGFYGQITQNAVICFQKRYNISPPYGYFGKLSRAKINEILNS